MTKNLIFTYSGYPITFKRNTSLMVNATEMSFKFNKQPNKYFRNFETKETLKILYLKQCVLNYHPNLAFDNRLYTTCENILNSKVSVKSLFGENSPRISKVLLSIDKNIYPESLVYIELKGRSSITWMHEDLAIDYARWLDNVFKLWMIDTIKTIISGNYNIRTQKQISENVALKELLKSIRNFIRDLKKPYDRLDKYCTNLMKQIDELNYDLQNGKQKVIDDFLETRVIQVEFLINDALKGIAKLVEYKKSNKSLLKFIENSKSLLK